MLFVRSFQCCAHLFSTIGACLGHVGAKIRRLHAYIPIYIIDNTQDHANNCLSHIARPNPPCIVAFKLFSCLEMRVALLVGGSNDVGQQFATCLNIYMQMTKCIITAEWGLQTYIWNPYIYMYARLRLGSYGPYICIQTDIEACTQSGAYIYIYTWILVPKAKSSTHSSIWLQEAMVYDP